MSTFISSSSSFTAEGGCDCKAVRYRIESAPLYVHCCHCRWCQRESGASFALNAMIEGDRVTNLGSEPEVVDTPSASGLGQKIARCTQCRVAVWSNYAGSGPVVKFVRVGTLDDPDLLPPDIHIFTASNNHGYNSRMEHPQCQSTTSARSTGRPKALPAGKKSSRLYWHIKRRSKSDTARLPSTPGRKSRISRA